MAFNIRYVKLTCTAHYDGSGTVMQFTGPFFINSNGTRFVWPSGTTYTHTNVSFSTNEYPTNAIGASIDGKACGIATDPFTITWDMNSAACDISIYNRVQLYTSNDTASVPGRNLRNFKIEVSSDGTNWYTACNAVDAPRLEANYSVQYTSSVFYYPLTIQLTPKWGGTCTDTILNGNLLTHRLIASENNGYGFGGFYNGSTKISEDKTYNITLTNSTTILVKFTSPGLYIKINGHWRAANSS